MSRINTTRFAVLGILATRPATGYEIHRAIRHGLAAFWSESYGQIYPALRTLVRQGQATVTDRLVATRPFRRQYRITAKGRAELAHWIAAPPRPAPIRNELLLKLWLADLGDGPACLDHLREFRTAQAARLAAHRRSEEPFGSGPDERHGPWQGLVQKAGTALAEAWVRWADDAIREVEGALRREARSERPAAER